MVGNFNSQYEDYYKNIRRGNSRRYFLNNRKSNKKNFIVRRMIFDLIGVFTLFILVIVCKTIVTPKTQAVYSYSKELVDKNYDYKVLLKRGREMDFNNIQKKAIDYIDVFKAKVTGEITLKEKVKSEFVLPVKGTVTSKYGNREDPFTKKQSFHKGIDIDVKENTEVKAAFNGIVKECGEDKSLGKYILIDHGKGIETKYAHLNEICVKKGQNINKLNVIGKSGSTGKSTAPHLHFEFIYMGENENPEEYIKISK